MASSPSLVVLLVLLTPSFADFVPKVCQKLAGHRAVKLPDVSICKGEKNAEQIRVDVTISVDNYEETMSHGLWIRGYQSECDTYTEWTGAKRETEVLHEQAFTDREVPALRQGLCPYSQNLLPMYQHMRAKCTYEYLRLTDLETVVRYCLATPVILTRTPGGFMHCDQVALQRCKYSQGICRTSGGGVVTWAVSEGSDKLTKDVWSGVASVYDDVLVLPHLQEAYRLTSKVRLGHMDTLEGIHVNVNGIESTSSSSVNNTASKSRGARDANAVSNAVKAMQAETNSKLQYLTTSTIEPIGDAIKSLCEGMVMH